MDPVGQLEQIANQVPYSMDRIAVYYPFIDVNYLSLLGCSHNVLHLVLNRLKCIVHSQSPETIQTYLSLQLENRPGFISNKLNELHAECLFYVYQSQSITWPLLDVTILLFFIESHYMSIEINDLKSINEIIMDRLDSEHVEQSLTCLQLCAEHHFQMDYSKLISLVDRHTLAVVDILVYQPPQYQIECLNALLTKNIRNYDLVYCLRHFKSNLQHHHIPLVLKMQLDFECLQDILSIIACSLKFQLPHSFVQNVVYTTLELLVDNDEDDPNTDNLLSDTIEAILINLSSIFAQFPMQVNCSQSQFIFYHWCCMYHLSHSELPSPAEMHPMANQILSQVCNFESLFQASHIWHSFSLVSHHPPELFKYAISYITDHAAEPQLMNGVLNCVLNTIADVQIVVMKLYRSVLILVKKLSQSNLVLVGQILNKLFVNLPLKLKSLSYLNMPQLQLLDIFEGILKMNNDKTYDIILNHCSHVSNEPFLILRTLEIISMIPNTNAMELMHNLFIKYKSELTSIFTANEMSINHTEDGVVCISDILMNLNQLSTQGKDIVYNHIFNALIHLNPSYISEIDVFKQLLTSLNSFIVYNFNPVYIPFFLPYFKYEEMEKALHIVMSWSIIHANEFTNQLCDIIHSEFLSSDLFSSLMPLAIHLQPTILQIPLEFKQDKDLIICTNFYKIKRHLYYYRLKHNSR